jgi:hypothetical protein
VERGRDLVAAADLVGVGPKALEDGQGHQRAADT